MTPLILKCQNGTSSWRDAKMAQRETSEKKHSYKMKGTITYGRKHNCNY